MKQFKDRLTELRKINKLSQQQIADILEINRSTYAYYETGKSMPKISTMKKLAAIFGISVSELISEGEEKYSDGVAISSTPYDLEWHAEKEVNALSSTEQLLLLKFRLMNIEQKAKLLKYIETEFE